MRLGIFGGSGDPLVDHTCVVARKRGHVAVVLPIHDSSPAAFDGESWYVAGEEVGECDGFVLRRYVSAHAPPPGLGEQPALDLQRWYQHSLAQQERSSLSRSLVMAAELAGKPVVNPLLRSAPFDHKPLQLAAFRGAGLKVPQTLVTNVAAAALPFLAEVGEAIAKPTVGGAETRVADEDFVARFAAARDASPVVFQERVRGSDIRATVVGDRVVSCVEIVTDALDYRADPEYRAGRGEYRPHRLPAAVAAACVTAARTCHQVLAGIDLKQRADGTYVFLEANSAPVYLDIERKTGAGITEAIVEWLEQQIA